MTTENTLLIAQEDYELLKAYVKDLRGVRDSDRSNATILYEELKKAKLIKKDDLPVDVVRLNSKVTVQEGMSRKVLELVLVVPEKADIKQKRISVLAPVGTALIGFRQGDKVKWNVPGGYKTFTIMKVIN
jgi:regulator of nucleoside diphosphate kinase